MTVREEIAKNLIYFRKKSKLTQIQLAKKIGVKNSAVSNWEKGLNSIDIDTLHKICVVFDICMNDMFGSFSNSKEKNDLTTAEASLLDNYRNLTDEGQQYINQTMRIALTSYKKEMTIEPDKNAIVKEAEQQENNKNNISAEIADDITKLTNMPIHTKLK